MWYSALASALFSIFPFFSLLSLSLSPLLSPPPSLPPRPQVNGAVLIEGVMRIYWGLTKAITVAGGNHIYVGRQQGGYTKQEDLPDQWRREVRDIQEQRISRFLDLVRTACGLV